MKTYNLKRSKSWGYFPTMYIYKQVSYHFEDTIQNQTVFEMFLDSINYAKIIKQFSPKYNFLIFEIIIVDYIHDGYKHHR